MEPTQQSQSKESIDMIEDSFTIIQDSEGRRILSLDGIGARAVLECRFLVELEKRTGKKIFEYFDLIIGTNTGALLAALICYLHYSAEDLMNIIIKYAQRVFPNSSLVKNIPNAALAIIGATIGDSKALEEFLIDLFQDQRLDAIETPKLIITSTHYRGLLADAFLFRNFTLEDPDIYEGTHSATIVQALLASLASPNYFPAVTFDRFTLVDGAVTSNNPAEVGLLQAICRIWPGEKCSFLLSLGSGDIEVNGNISESTSKVVSRVMSDAVLKFSDTRSTHNNIVRLMQTSSSQLDELFYVRLQPELTKQELISWTENNEVLLRQYYNKGGEYLMRRLDTFVLMFENKLNMD